MKHEPTLAGDILHWLARLPFLAARNLSLLTGQPLPDIDSALGEMDRNGHVDWVTPSSPELDSGRLYVLTEPTRQHVANERREGGGDQSALPILWSDVTHRLARVEATAALNGFVANLVMFQRRSIDVDLQDVWSVPARRPSDAWWPLGVEAFGCFRSGERIAPFFVLVDRAGTPAVHRAALIAGWYQFRDRRQHWGANNAPSILVLCPNSKREAEWARQVEGAADRRGVPSMNVVLADRSSLPDAPDDPAWRGAGASTRTTLGERLSWWRSPSTPGAYPSGVSVPPRPQGGARLRLQMWAQAKAAAKTAAPDRERIAALALATGATEKRLLDCLGRYPLLTTAELGVVLGVAPHFTRRAVERLLRIGLIVRHGEEQDPEDRYCLTVLAIRLLALRDGVPFRRYLQHAPVTAMPEEPTHGLPTLLQQRDHTVGTNSFFVSMLTRATEDRHLALWEGASEAVATFSWGGERRTVRPDGAGVVVYAGRTHRFFLEWDRGTERIAVLLEKLARYANYYRAWPSAGPSPATLLIACPSPQRENVMWRAVTTVFANESSCRHLLTTTHPHLDLYGPFGMVWRGYGRNDRAGWPGGE